MPRNQVEIAQVQGCESNFRKTFFKKAQSVINSENKLPGTVIVGKAQISFKK